MSARQSWPKRIMLAVTAVMLATWSSLLIPGAAFGAGGAPAPGGGGNNGTVKICDIANGCPNSNDPHLNCPITIQWTGFDTAPAGGPQDTYDVTFSGISPTNGTVTANGAGNTDHGTFGGPDTSKQYSLQIANGTPNNKGEYHIGIDITTTDANGSDFKQKTVWVASCAVVNPTQTVSASGACNPGSGNYEWTISTAPSTGGVTGTYTPSGGTQTSYTTLAGGSTPTFSTGHVNSIDFTVSSPGWAVAAGASPATAPSDARCNAPNTVDPTASATATCSALGASLNAGTNATTFSITVNGNPQPSVPVPANGTQSVSYPPAAGATISVSAPNMTTVTATAPASCGGNNPTPPSATATSTCSVASVHLDAGSTATDFTVTEPAGTHQVHVPANQTQDVTYTPGANVTISVSANGTVLSSATSPASCGAPPPGQPQPDATATNACVTGITVVLSNMNGTAPATFTVTGPDGTTTTVPVNAGQLKKLEFAVAEDTTGVVTVSAPGLAKTFTYAKNCTKVLGEKHTIKPPKTPVTKVLGEKQQLPFTGFNAKAALFDAASMMALGAIVCALALPRRRRFAPHLEG